MLKNWVLAYTSAFLLTVYINVIVNFQFLCIIKSRTVNFFSEVHQNLRYYCPRSSMDRVTDFESGGCAFDPRRGHTLPDNFIDQDPSLNLIRLLLIRLERISVDSYWAHRASGVRGALIRALDDLENERSISTLKVGRLIQMGFTILETAIRSKRI